MQINFILAAISLAIGSSSFCMSSVTLAFYSDSASEKNRGPDFSVFAEKKCADIKEEVENSTVMFRMENASQTLDNFDQERLSTCSGVAVSYSFAMIASILQMGAFTLGALEFWKLWSYMHFGLFVLHLLAFSLGIHFSKTNNWKGQEDSPALAIPLLNNATYMFGYTGLGLTSINCTGLLFSLGCALYGCTRRT